MKGLRVSVFFCALFYVSCLPMTEWIRRDFVNSTTTGKPLLKDSTPGRFLEIEMLVDKDDVKEEAAKPTDIMMSLLKNLFKFSKKEEKLTNEGFKHIEEMAMELKIDAFAIGKVAEAVAKWANVENTMLPLEFKKAVADDNLIDAKSMPEKFLCKMKQFVSQPFRQRDFNSI